jgi:hypothetical protein
MKKGSKKRWNDRKEWETGNSVEKNTEEEEMRRKEYIYMPCQAIPLTISSYRWPSHHRVL